MARPEGLGDIETTKIEFGTIELGAIGTEASLLKGYTALLEAVNKTPGAEVEQQYNSMKFSRMPNLSEQMDQLKRAQDRWDECKATYEKMASVGSLEYSYLESMAKEYATSENLPYPPEHEPISSYDAVIRDIDQVTA